MVYVERLAKRYNAVDGDFYDAINAEPGTGYFTYKNARQNANSAGHGSSLRGVSIVFGYR